MTWRNSIARTTHRSESLGLSRDDSNESIRETRSIRRRVGNVAAVDLQAPAVSLLERESLDPVVEQSPGRIGQDADPKAARACLTDARHALRCNLHHHAIDFIPGSGARARRAARASQDTNTEEQRPADHGTTRIVPTPRKLMHESVPWKPRSTSDVVVSPRSPFAMSACTLNETMRSGRPSPFTSSMRAW